MARNDGRTQAPNIFGKPGTSYPYDDLAYPTIIERRTATQDTKLKALLTPHDRTPAALLTATNNDPGDNTDAGILEKYEVLPGPWIPFTRYDLNLGPIQGRRRAVVNTNQVATLTATAKTTYEARGLSDVVSYEIEEINSNGTGDPDNPTFPILTSDTYDTIRGPVQSASQVVVATGSEVGSLTETGGVVTKVTYETINQFLLRKVTETYTLPGPIITEDRPDDRAKIIIAISKQLKKLSAISSGFTAVNDTSATTIHKQDYDEVSAIQITAVYPQSPYHDVGTALIEDKYGPYQFPSYLDVVATDLYGTAIGYRGAYSENERHIIRTYWVINSTKPTLAFNEISPGDIVINNVPYKRVLHDQVTRTYLGTPIVVPATVPTFTQYFGASNPADPLAPGTPPKWIGTERVIDGGVEEDGHPNRWRVSSVSVVMK